MSDTVESTNHERPLSLHAPHLKAWTLIVIHGVGDPVPGATLLDISRGIHDPSLVGERADVVVDGFTFPRLKINSDLISQIIEVRWSDIARPRRRALSVANYGVRIVAALLDVGSRLPWADTVASKAYRTSFEALLAYCIYPALIAMFCLILPRGEAVVVGLVGATLVAAFTWYLGRFGGALWVGWAWCAVILVGSVLFSTGVVSDESFVRMTTILYVGGQVVTSAFLLVTLLLVACRSSVAIDRRIAAAAICYFPFFILSGMGALLWALAFSIAKLLPGAQRRFEVWQQLYSRGLASIGYNLALVEFSFAALVSAVGLGLVSVGMFYAWRVSGPHPEGGRQAGERSRNGIRNVLAAGGACFALLSFVYVASAISSWRGGANLAVLEIYSISALRIVPYLPLVVGPLASVTGTIVDVLFYVAESKSVAIAPVVKSRLELALAFAASCGGPIAVLAHSQGSVIAVDVLGERSHTSLRLFVTAGSPLRSLYDRFLGSTPETRAAQRQTAFNPPHPWIDFVRDGDYIGANQGRPGVTEIDLGAGGHTGYWRDGTLWSFVFNKLAELQL